MSKDLEVVDYHIQDFEVIDPAGKKHNFRYDFELITAGRAFQAKGFYSIYAQALQMPPETMDAVKLLRQHDLLCNIFGLLFTRLDEHGKPQAHAVGDGMEEMLLLTGKANIQALEVCLTDFLYNMNIANIGLMLDARISTKNTYDVAGSLTTLITELEKYRGESQGNKPTTSSTKK